MITPPGNLFHHAEPPTTGERFDELLRHKNLVVERIVSSSSIERCEYVQPQDEWVLLVQGEATMTVDGNTVTLKAGDYLFLPARIPHSVEKTSAGAVWLAIHLHPETPKSLETTSTRATPSSTSPPPDGMT